MTDDLQHDLRQLPPPSLDVSPDFCDRVMTTARHRQRIRRAGATGLAAAVVGVIVAVSVSLTSTSNTARLVPITPPSPSAVTPTPSPSETPTPTPSASATPSPVVSAASAPPSLTPTSAPPVVVSYPPLSYANLPYPATCPTGYEAYGNWGTESAMCVPPGYGPKDTNDCPAGSHWSMGPVVCSSDGQPYGIVAPKSSPGLPSIPFANLPTPSCQSGYAEAGTFPTVNGLLHCAPAAYLPRAGYTCPAGSQFFTDPAPLCFTSTTKETIVAPVPSG